MADSKGFATYLQGNEPLEKRLCTGERAFLAPLSIPPPQKEDIVVLWLSHILTTDKALELSATDLEATWSTLKRILNSRRLQALCRNHWLCPITSSLTETLVSTLCDDNSTNGVRHNVVGVCDAILKNSSLAPLIMHHAEQCYKLLNGLIHWILLGNKCDTTLSVTLLLSREVASHVRSHGSRKAGCHTVLQWLFLPTARLTQGLKDDERHNVKILIAQLHKIIIGTMFERELLELYKQSLLTLLATENKAVLTGVGEKFFKVLGNALAEESLEVNEVLINLFLKNFMIKYKSDTSLLYQMIVVLIHMLGITWQCEKGPCVEANSLAGQKLAPVELSDEAQLQLLLTVLQVLESVSVDLSCLLSELSFSDWLQNLSMHLLQERQPSSNVYKCLQTIMDIYPTLLTNKVEIVLANIICCKKEMNCVSSEFELDKSVESYNAYDSLMCAILNTFIKLRSVPKLYSKLLNGIKDKRSFLAKKTNILPQTPLEFEKGLLLPPKFMSLLNDAVSHLSFRHVMDLWTTALHFLKNECCPLLCATENAQGDFEYVNLVLWLLSYVISCSPVLSAVAVPGMASKVSTLMTKMANDGIAPLASAVLDLSSNDNTTCLGSFLSFCHAWGEAHLLLCTTEEGYTELPELPTIGEITEKNSLANFSYLFPFVTSNTWDKFSNTVNNIGDQPAKLAWVQLSIQKLSYIISLDKSNNITLSLRNNVMSSLLGNLSTSDIYVAEFISFHLTYILPYVIEDDMPMIARHVLAGFREDHKMWVKYVQSEQFKEASLLHSYILSSICTAISTVTNSRKRHISGSSETEESVGLTKNYGSKLLKKISKNTSLFTKFEFTKEADNVLLEFFTECGGILSKVINSGVAGTGVGGNSQELVKLVELISYLPLPHMGKEMQTALLLVLLPLLIYEGSNGRDELVAAVIRCINEALCAPCPLRLLHIVTPNEIFQWLINEVITWPTNNIPLVNKFYNIEGLSLKDINSQNCCISTGLQHILKTMLRHLVTSVRNTGHVTSLAEFITTSADGSEKSELYLQVAVLFTTVCFKFLEGSRGGGNEMSVACNWVVYHLSMWALRLLKHLDLASAAPNTAANLLTIHMMLIQIKCKQSTKASAEPEEMAEPSDIKDKKEGKTPKWKKMIGRSVQLSELCLKSGNDQLESCALDFLSTVATHAVTLGPTLPQGLLSTAWTPLKCGVKDKHTISLHMPDKLSNKAIGTSQMTGSVSLAPLFAVADVQEYEQLLLDLLKKTQECIYEAKEYSESLHDKWESVSYTLGLWQIVVCSRVEGHHGALKRQALEHLTVILVSIVSSIDENHETDVQGLVIPVLQTMAMVLSSGVSLATQRLAQTFVLCTTIPLHSLNTQLFLKAFPSICELMNLLVTRHGSIVVQRTPSLMAAITHLTTAVISQANQEKHLDNAVIQKLEACSNNLERVVREIAQYSADVNKIVHFTVANIVEALQQITVYPAIKSIIESIVYRLLDLCDNYCLRHLMVALPPASTTLLKHLHNNYNTYRRFRDST